MKNILIIIFVLLLCSFLLNITTACDSKDSSNSFKLSIVDPTAETNPDGAYFPGFRGGNQLIKYTPKFGQYTETNEYGSEIVVINNQVINQTGSNSRIPKNGYVLSGHGSAKKWLNSNTIIGTYICIKNNVIYADTKPESYLFRADTMIKEARNSLKENYQNKQAETLLTDALNYYKQAKTSKIERDIIDYSNKSYDIAELAYYKSIKPVNNLEHGVWVRPIEKNDDEIKQKIQIIKEAGLNNVYLETFYHGKTIYPSEVLSDYGFANKDSIKFDLLNSWVKIAHENNIKVHVWIETFYVGPKMPAILEKHPEWANVQRSSAKSKTPVPSTVEPGAYFLDPANPDVRKFIVELITEITMTYDIDGVNLDYIRYPNSLPEHFPDYLNTTWGYSNFASASFENTYGKNPLDLQPSDTLWNDWISFRQSQVNKTVESVYNALQKNKPEVELSAVVFPDIEKARIQKLQNWQEWVNGSYINTVTPIILGSSPELVSEYTLNLMQICGQTTNVYIGVFGAFNNDLPVTFVKQIVAASKAGSKGVNIFDLTHLNSDYLKAIKEGPFKKQ